MTLKEKEKLMTMSFNDLWSDLWGNFTRMQYAQEEKQSRQKFQQIKEGIYMFEKEFYSLETLIKESDTKWTTPEWGFPKGRRNYMETDNVCAIKNLMRKLVMKSYIIINNVMPYEEIFMGSNYKCYNTNTIY